ncbi:unnamed protein product [Polarella glacialis]|uniref:DUF488 domain-containing protein n=3 Tax=Polarella glacialis TaxID=89957 RepID=A0A813ETK2_POLGL|nr:unnamed protein product [Polarella glacialis]
MSKKLHSAIREVTPPLIYSIGHSNHEAHHFFELLSKHNVTCLVDVRSIASSSRFPHFKMRSLEDLCYRQRLTYRHCPELGNKVGGIVHLLAQPEGQAALTDLVLAASRVNEGATAYMCAEADWRDCHRQVISQKLLHDFSVPTVHLLRDGKSELHPRLHMLPDCYGLKQEVFTLHPSQAAASLSAEATMPGASMDSSSHRNLHAGATSAEDECCAAPSDPGVLDVQTDTASRPRRWGKRHS